MIPSREIFWNVGNLQGTVYLIAMISVAIAATRVVQRIRRWQRGRSEKRLDPAGDRLKYLLQYLLSHERILKDTYAGAMHLLIFWGFFVLLLGTLIIAFQEDFLLPFFGGKVLEGSFYLIYSLALDLFGLSAIIGIGLALYRRYVVRPRKLDNRLSDLVLFGLILGALFSGFCVEGLRLNATQPSWMPWEPIGWIFGGFFKLFATAQTLQRSLHKFFWWIHLIVSMGLIAYLPFSNLFHIFSSSLNVFFRSLKPKGTLSPVDFAKGAPFGVAKIQDFTWKDLLDLDACTRCGRCQESCPAFLSEKPLNPKKVVLDLKASLNRYPQDVNGPPLAGNSVSEDELWACTTCRACVEMCPVEIEQLGKIVDLRRYSVLTESKFPSEYKQIFKNMEIFGDPLGKGKLTREDWTPNLDINKLYAIDPNRPIDILYWVGCIGASYDDRSRNTVIAAAKVLKKAGANFGILGKEELCCGDPARRMGNEYLFQEFVRKNMELFAKYGIKKVVTHCPHCFNVFKKEYPSLGADFEVLSLVELIEALIQQRKLEIKSKVGGSLTFHDPCYLGRYNSFYQKPREILTSFLGVTITEMGRIKEKSFCCGAGGGNMWRGAPIGKRIEGLRIEEAIETKAQGVVTACPYCGIMFDSAIKQKGLEYSFKLVDLMELINQGTTE